ncbi:MAG: hypothetical protein J4215_03005 [Candidatus Diapherotrites archaeon]|uniref:Diphthamide synthase domain-containing protein n=1 Tax=Candidatus Iainarchaeum sp. TaxID=3101447 RepID=A0A8T4LF54_9ARCH|nr:hypothetical protein [Candidatus Diapherotrites archaeon]
MKIEKEKQITPAFLATTNIRGIARANGGENRRGIDMNVCVLFSGGKDSMLATQLAITSGHQIKCLVSFKCDTNYLFDTINLKFVEMAAQAMQIPLQEFELGSGKDETLLCLHESLISLKKQFKIQGIVTGAQTPSGKSQLLERLCAELQLTCIHPLIGIKQHNVLYAALKNKYKVMIVKTDGYQQLLGQVLDEKTIEEHDSKTLEHAVDFGKGSIILDSPLFRKKIHVVESESVHEGTIMKLLLTGMVLENK